MSSPDIAPLLKRPLRLFDLVGFYVISALSLRWIATAAAVGPGALALWAIAWAAFFLPLAASVLALSRRYPGEGGLYIWTREAWGDRLGFLAGWTYWTSNLPYFPAVLYFAAASLLYARRGGETLSANSAYYMTFSVAILLVITALNIVGLNWSKWLGNIGALGVWIPVFALIFCAAITLRHSGAATRFTSASLIPSTTFKDAVFWSTIAFAFGGCEAASFMGDEIENPGRNIPRALFIGGVVVTLGYMVGTIAMLIALPAGEIRGLGGFMLAIQRMCSTLGLGALVAPVAILVALSNVGSASAYFTATARLPFVAGLDSNLPAVFGRIHPRWGTPYVAVIAYGAAGVLFAFLGQAGASVKSAYDVLVSMSVLTYFIPYAFLFASVLRLARPGRLGLRALACLGLLTTLATLFLSAIPAEDEPRKVLTVVKTVGSTVALLIIGAVVYEASRRSVRRGAVP